MTWRHDTSQHRSVSGRAPIIVGLTVGLLLFLFYRFDPARVSLFPPCLFKQLTGWSCAGCGSQRALHELLHGNVAAAYHLNPLIFMVLPVVVGLLFQRVGLALAGRPVLSSFKTGTWVWWLVGGIIVFTIIRNLPSSPWRG
jgi:hypothetical protein